MSLFSNKRGFTLIEILIAVAIIGILVSVIFATIQGARKKSRDAQRVSDITQIQTALRVYKDAEGEYPIYPNGELIGDGTGLEELLADYLPSAIKDPLNSGPNRYYYDSAHACNVFGIGGNGPVLIAVTMEGSGQGNYTTVCSSFFANLGNGVIPTANTYVVILK